MLQPGFYRTVERLWDPNRVKIETYDRLKTRFEHRLLDLLVEVRELGLHVFWKQAGKTECWPVDLWEKVAEVADQEIMTADKVTLRVDPLVTYQVADATLAVTEVREALVSRVADFGITVRSVDVRYIILLGELKTILNQVIEAQKRAETNLLGGVREHSLIKENVPKIAEVLLNPSSTASILVFPQNSLVFGARLR